MEQTRMVRKGARARRRGERGAILILTVIGMVAFLLIAGLAIDVSHLYLVGTELQNAADSAAISAASALNSGATGITEAVNRAVTPMNSYEFNSTSIQINREDVRFAVNLTEFDNGGTGRSEADAAASPANIRFVKVSVTPKNVTMFFAQLALGSNVTSLSRSAVAGQSTSINVVCNLEPLVPVQDDVTGAPLAVNSECANKTSFTPGCTYTIRAAPNNSISAGNYQILALSGPGGADVRVAVAMGADACYRVGDVVDTKPGVDAGPVRQGMNTRFDDFSANLDPAAYPPDTNIKTGITYAQYISGNALYQQSPSNPGLPNRRLLVLPIVNASEFDNGRTQVHIAGFGVFFMQDKVPNGNGGDILAEYVSSRVVVGDGSYDPGAGPGVTQLTVPVLYR